MVRSAITRLYGPEEAELFQLDHADGASVDLPPASPIAPNSAILSVYPDHISDGGNTLEQLDAFLDERFASAFETLHILPFFPSTGDGGYAVSDHKAVSSRYGTWREIRKLSARFRLIADLVLNHVSSSHFWVSSFLAGDAAFDDFFIELDPKADLRAIERPPRDTPVLSPFKSSLGVRHLWTTFGPDQVDLNYRNPAVLRAIRDIAQSLASEGVSSLRLDAIAYVWKEFGSSCANLPQAADVLRLLRAGLGADRPNLIAEVDAELQGHFLRGDGADFAFRFDLAPCLAHSLVTGKSDCLYRWISSNSGVDFSRSILFLANHDSLYLRPQAPILDDREVDDLVETAIRVGCIPVVRGDRIYQISGPLHLMFSGEFEIVCRRIALAMFLLASLPGIPMVYLNTLLAAPLAALNSEEGPRSINRYKFGVAEIHHLLQSTCREKLLARVLGIFSSRRRMNSLAADRPLMPVSCTTNSIIFARGRHDERVYVVANLSASNEEEIYFPAPMVNLESGESVGRAIRLLPLQFGWFAAENDA